MPKKTAPQVLSELVVPLKKLLAYGFSVNGVSWINCYLTNSM